MTPSSNQEARGAESGRVPAGYISGADARARYKAEAGRLATWVRRGKIARVKLGQENYYREADVTACLKQQEGRREKRQAGPAPLPLHVCDKDSVYLVWGEIAYELLHLREAREVAGDIAHRWGRDRTIYVRRRWNGRVIDTPLETVTPSGRSRR